MNSKIIMAISGLSDADSLFSCVKDIIGNTESMIVEANISDDNELSASYADTRSMQEIKDRVYANAISFENTCMKFKIKHATRPQFDNYFLKDLVEDSRFADLIMCSSTLPLGCENLYELNTRIRSLFNKLECPLFAIPENCENLMLTNLFIYDGSAEAIQAIKNFTYLFTDRCSNGLFVINSSGQNEEFEAMMSWLSAHYHNVSQVKEPMTHNQHNLICGARDKSTLTASHKVPVFVYHA